MRTDQMSRAGGGADAAESSASAATTLGAGAGGFRRSAIYMDTFVTVDIPHPTTAAACESAAERAFGWFAEVERRCSRFDPDSELSRLGRQVQVATPVSPLLFGALDFALAVAARSDGAFDPTVGAALERAGFNRNFRTGREITSGVKSTGASYRDVLLDPPHQTVMLTRPLALDLGAVAKGLAIDLATRELQAWPDYAINAGGDIFVRGQAADGAPWQVGVRHPREEGALMDLLAVSDLAVCTSGDYERPGTGRGHHIVRPGSARPVDAVASVTVLAPTTMAADAFATAAFVLGPTAGIAFLEREGVEGILVSPALECWSTPGFVRYERR